MEADDRVWVSFHFPGDLVWSSVPLTAKKIPLTYETCKKKRVHSAWSRDLSGTPILAPETSSINRLNTFVCGWVICRDICDEEAAQILLKYLSKHVKVST